MSSKNRRNPNKNRPVYRSVCLHINVHYAVVNDKTRVVCKDCGAIRV